MNFIFILPIGNITPGAVTEGNLINLAAVENFGRRFLCVVLMPSFQFKTGMSQREIRKSKIEKKKKTFIFCFNFQKIGSGGSVKQKIKNSGLSRS